MRYPQPANARLTLELVGRTTLLAGRIEWNLSTVRSLQHALAIVFAGVAETVVSVQPFP